jgi:general secretion pathway protein G
MARSRVRGFTLLELLLTGAVAALLLSIAIPGYQSVIERQRIGQAVRDLVTIAMNIQAYRTMHAFKPPASLQDLPEGTPLQDPWGNDYRYLRFEDDDLKDKTQVRKDHNLHPLNTEFDLYSVGPDGDTRAPLTAKASQDDVIWARDGGFVGVARDY